MKEECKNKEVAFWEVGEKEILGGHKTIYRAIEAWIEQKYNYEQDPTKTTIFPRHIEVIGYAKIKHPDLRGAVLDWVIENYDDELGNPDSFEASNITEVMKIAADKFINTMEQEYDHWQCEDVEKRIIDLVDYFGMHPELIDGMIVKFEGV